MSNSPGDSATPCDALAAATHIAGALTRFRFRWRDEFDLQQQIATALERQRIEAGREVNITRADRPDFLAVHGGQHIVIEVKIQGSVASVLRQVGRYAAQPTVDAVILASTRRQLVSAIPAAVLGVPVIPVLLGAAGVAGISL